MKKIILLLLLVFVVIAAFRKKDITIKGNVKDEKGNTVTATILAGSVTTTSNANGSYNITINDKQEYLVFSAVGYVTQKVNIKNRTIINVIMKVRCSLQDSTLKNDAVTRYAQNMTKAISGKIKWDLQ